MKHPFSRPRRLRQNPTIRNMVANSNLSAQHLIQPLFITQDASKPIPIKSMPGIYRYSPELVIEEIKELVDLGISTIALFPDNPQEKRTADAKESYNPNGLVQQTIKKIKSVFPEVVIMADVALDLFTNHGHDGLVGKNGDILNDQTLEVLSLQSLSLVQAGADIIAPSDMMDGRIGSIRNALEQSGFNNTIILSYCVKYASSLYSPFREGAGSSSSLQKKDKKSYQMDFRNYREGFIEASLDISEGADILMVKPGLPYLDIISKLKQRFDCPIAAYHTSGEYTMQKLALEKKYISDETIEEILFSFRRAGADVIISYFSKEFIKKTKKHCFT